MSSYKHAGAASGDALMGAFARIATKRSNDAAFVSPERQSTFGDIDRLAEGVAAQIDTEPGTLVGLVAPNGPAFLAGLLALRRAGQAVLLLDASAPAADHRRALSVLGAGAVLECTTAWPSSKAAFRYSPILGAASPATPPGAVVKLTSGSTGTPRGVAMPFEGLLADEAALYASMALRPSDRLLASIPMSHSYGLTTLSLSALVRGLTLVLPAEDGGPFAALSAAGALGATVFPTGPAYIQSLLRVSQRPAWPSTLRLVISAGAPLPSAPAARFRETFGQPVHAFYGSSECGGICYDREGGAAERGTVGTPVDGVRITLKPFDGGDEDEGLVRVCSASVGETYLPEPDARLQRNSFETSDVAAWQGSELALRRRADRVINVRGRKVDPSEVERVLATLAGVEEAVVLGIAAPERNEHIVRAVIACPSRQLGYEDIAAWCRPRLAEHKVPRSVVIVDAIPRTARGKIDHSALLALRATDKGQGVAHG